MDDQPGTGAAVADGSCRAVRTISLLSELLNAHPTTIRENRSRKTVRYNQPRSVSRCR